MKRGIAILIVSALLLGGLGLAAEPWPSRAATFVTLSSSGWNPASVGTWDPATQTGTLTSDIAQGIQILSDGVVLEGNGHIVTGSGSGAGVYLNRRSGVTVRNVTARGFQYGIFLYYSNNNTVSGNSVSGNKSHGVYLNNSTGNTLEGNSSTGNTGDGFLLDFSPGNTLTGNSASGNPNGVSLCWSGNNTLAGNTMSGNGCDFRVDAEADYDYGQNIDASNRVGANKSLYYLHGKSGVTVPADAGVVYLINCTNVTLQNLALSGSQAGVLLWKTSNSRLENLQVSGTSAGIWLRSSSGNTLLNNTSTGASYAGIYLESSNDNTLTGNTLQGHRPYGLLVKGGTGNSIYNNRFLDNSVHASVDVGGNVFSQPKPKGGNYWDTWDEPDADGDLIVDNPYHFDISQVDEYPWAKPDGWVQLPPATPTPEPTIGATFVTGGGWIDPSQPSLPGKAHVEVVCRHAEGSETPTGKVNLQLAGGFQFHSTAFDTLAVDNGQAWCSGQGTADGGTYRFVLAVADGAAKGGKGDKMRIKVWDDATSLVLYDSEPGADDWAAPESKLGGGNITIHKE